MKRIIILFAVVLLYSCETGFDSSSEPGNFSMGGSTARFAISGDYLYSLDNNTLTSFHLKSESEVVKVGERNIPWNDMETIFPYGDYLFIGSTTGVLIFSLANPANPNQISEFAHVVSCDPVVVQGDYAYSTLRGGNRCGENFDRLDIIDISNITKPLLVASYDLTSPRGLAINNGCLYVCDDGIKVLDVSDHSNIQVITHLPGIPANDVIFFNDQLLVTADDGFYQYNVSNCGTLTELGHFDYY
jgi:hypothetical protein